MSEAPSGFQKIDAMTSWGRVTRQPHLVATPRFPDELQPLIAAFSRETPGLAIGLRRSYGSSNLNPDGLVIDMTRLDSMISFDRETGLMRAEAGVSLSQCLQALVPAGWFLPTTPGTRFVTLGGAVANDVHGKNHHEAGSFGASVTKIGLHRSDGEFLELTAGDDLFRATVGGLGLTGVIAWVEFQAVPITSAWLDSEDFIFANIDEYFDISSGLKSRFSHTMAWVDCLADGDNLGRGVLSAANWSKTGELKPHREQPKIGMPLDAPGFALNSLSVKSFNTLYNALKKARAGEHRVHYEPFLYPLDAIANWNRLYGGKGFYQYQCVVPPNTARGAVNDLLIAIAESGQGSMLAVLKDFGDAEPAGLLSFPMEGTTLALDFKNQGEKTLKLMAELDRIVLDAGGRLYPAKDGRMPAEMFSAGYPDLDRFTAHVDPAFSSSFWKQVSE